MLTCKCSAICSTGSLWRSPKGFHRFFPPAFVNSQIAQVDGPTVLEEMVFGSSLLCGGSLCYFAFFFLLKIDDLGNSFQYEIRKKIPDNISGFECEVPVKEPEKMNKHGSLLTA